MLRRRRPVTIRRQRPRVDSRQTRIRIPQPPYRPIRLLSRTALREEEIRTDPWWFVAHRRGIRRPLIGEDPLEARAVSERTVRGTLPERILYKKLLEFRLVPGADFDFQTSMQGGRLELGGLVADFVLLQKRIVIRIQGPTHRRPLVAAKDAEQKMILEQMGYWVVDITDQQVYDEMFLTDWLRNLLGYGKHGGSGMADSWVKLGLDEQYFLDEIIPEVMQVMDKIESLARIYLW